MERSTFMIILFGGISLFSKVFAVSEVGVLIPSNNANLNLSCGSNEMIIVKNAKITCPNNFWLQKNTVDIRGSQHVSAEAVIFEKDGQKKYKAVYVKGFWSARFFYISGGSTKWEMEVKTDNTSNNIFGRIYFSTDCSTWSSMVSLANSFDNFTPGKTDIFTFKAPDITKEHFCVRIQNTVHENWILNSVKLTNQDNGYVYMFYHGEKMTRQMYNVYRGPNPYYWIVKVATGNEGTDNGIDITLKCLKCETVITLDNEYDNFIANSTDTFQVPAAKCGLLESIQLTCQNKCQWIMEHVTVTARDDPTLSYQFFHGETLMDKQTFFISQISGPNEWNVFVCTKTSTDKEVYMQLFGSQFVTDFLRLTTPEDDFQANQCSNFTLFLKDIGDLEKINMVVPKLLVVDRLFISNNQSRYQFHLLGARLKRYMMVVYRNDFLIQNLSSKNVEIDLGDIFTVIGVKVKNTMDLASEVGRKLNDQTMKWEPCFHNQSISNYMKCTQPIIGQYVQIKSAVHPGTIELVVRPKVGKTIWFLDILFPSVVGHAYIRLEDSKLRTFVSYISTMTKKISTYFYTKDRLLENLNQLIIITEPSDFQCDNITVQMTKVKSDEVLYGIPNATSFRCSWSFVYTLLTSAIKPNSPPTPKKKAQIILLRPPQPTKKPTLAKTGSPVLSIYQESALPKTESITYPNDTIEHSTVPYRTVSLINTNVEDRTVCKCICQRPLTKTEEAKKIKKLVKELKVNKNQTNSYIRSKTSAPDERVSSKVIGSTAVILMSVPFGLIVLVDLFPIFNFICKKAVSLM